jgi:hypothetical protein
MPGLPYRPWNVALWEAALEGAQDYMPLKCLYGHFLPEIILLLSTEFVDKKMLNYCLK